MTAMIMSMHNMMIRPSSVDLPLLPVSLSKADMLLLKEPFEEIMSEISTKQVAGSIARDPASAGNPALQRAWNSRQAATSVTRAPARRRMAGSTFFSKKCGMFTKARIWVISDMTTMKQTRL